MARKAKTYASPNAKFRELAAVHLTTIQNGARKLEQLAMSKGIVFNNAEAQRVRETVERHVNPVKDAYAKGRDTTGNATAAAAGSFFDDVEAPPAPPAATPAANAAKIGAKK